MVVDGWMSGPWMDVAMSIAEASSGRPTIPGGGGEGAGNRSRREDAKAEKRRGKQEKKKKQKKQKKKKQGRRRAHRRNISSFLIPSLFSRPQTTGSPPAPTGQLLPSPAEQRFLRPPSLSSLSLLSALLSPDAPNNKLIN